MDFSFYRTVTSADTDGDGKWELILIGEPTGEESEPGFELYLYDPMENRALWTRELGYAAP